MKIFIGCDEVASILSGLSNGFEALGHQVTTLVKTRHKFYNYTYSYNLDFLSKYIDRNKLRNPLINKAYGLVKNVTRECYVSAVLPQLIKEHDLFIFLWSSLKSDFSDLQLIKNSNKKIVSIFVGSDVRDPYAFQQEFGSDPNLWGSQYFNQFNTKLKWLRLNELYSDAIFSVPDQAGLALRPYSHLYLPFSPNGFIHCVPRNNPLKVLHAPSQSGIKGTKVILSVLYRLKSEGLPIEISTLQGVPHEVLKRELANADVLVDELILHGPGMLSLEAMASGCAVATKFLESHKNIFNPPVCSINEANIADRLLELFKDEPYRLHLAMCGKKYVEEYNSPSRVASRIIQQMTDKSNVDYYPQFYLNKYNLPTGISISPSNLKLTDKILRKYGIPKGVDLQKAKERGLISDIPENLLYFEKEKHD